MLILTIAAVLIGTILAVLFWPALWPEDDPDPTPPTPPRPSRPRPPMPPSGEGGEGGATDPKLEDDQ